MISFLKFILRQNVFFNMLFIGLMGFGCFVAIPQLPVERYPNINFGDAIISTSYPGASTEEVERKVTEEIEDALRGMEDIEFVRSSSKNGFSNVNVKFVDDTDYDKLYEEMRLRVLGIQNRFPVVNGKPLNPQFNVTTVDDWLPVIQVNVISKDPAHPLSKRSLGRLAEELQLKFEAIDGVKEVILSGQEVQQMILALDPQAMLSYGLNLAEIQRALIQGGGDVPAGAIDTARGELSLIVDDRYRSSEDLLNTIVRHDGHGSLITLRQIVDLSQTKLEKIQGGVITTVNGTDAVSCKITKKSSANAKTIKAEVLKVNEAFQLAHGDLPIELNTTLDSTVKIDDGLGVLQSSLGMSMVLVMLAIFLFLSPRPKSTMIWVSAFSVAMLLVMIRYNESSTVQLIALGLNTLVIFATCRAAVLTVTGIAFSFIGCLLMFYIFGYSLNEITLLGFVLTSGIIVDDAIVVLENIQRLREKGLPMAQAAVEGTAEVFWPVVSASLTTIAAFMPMLLMTGSTGDFFSLIPITVTTALVISLFECLFLMPIHSVDLERFHGRKHSATSSSSVELSSVQETSGLVQRMTRIYDRSLGGCLAHPYLSLLGVFFLLLLSVAIIAQSLLGPSQGYAPLLKLKFFPDDTSTIQIEYRTPAHSSLLETDALGRKIARELLLKGPGTIKSVTANTGITLDTAYKPIFGSYLGFMMVELPEKSLRQFNNASQLIAQIRRELEEKFELNGVYLEVGGQKDGPPIGAPVHVRCSGVIEKNVVQLGHDLYEYIQSNLKKGQAFEGLIDLKSDRQSSHPILRFKSNPESVARHGLTPAEVRFFAATLFEGAYVGELRLEDEDLPIRMRLKRSLPVKPEELLQLPIVQRGSQLVFYGDVGAVTQEEEPTTLERRNFQRVINVTANIDENALLQAQDFMASIKTWVEQHQGDYPGTQVSFGGEAESTAKSYKSLFTAFILALFLIYGILAVQFRSYSQPLLIMSNIAFSVIGVVLMLGLIGGLMLILPQNLIAPERAMITVQSFIAVVGLTGLVVNDAIVLIDFINLQRDRGLALEDAVRSGAHQRVRPIIMTTWSTIAGLIPLAIGIPDFSITWGPFATCFIAGLSMSTLITLLILPVLYILLERFKSRWVG
jgi:multidrug efflux pump subunit AcrB